MKSFWLLIFTFLLFSAPAWATVYYTDLNCGNVATYNPTTRACTGGTATVRTTIAGGISLLASGDTLYVKAGTYNERMESWNGKSGNASAAGWGTSSWSESGATVVEGVGTVLLNNTAGACISVGTPTAGNEHKYIVIRNFKCDGQRGYDSGVSLGGGGNGGLVHHIKLENIEVTGYLKSAVYLGGNQPSGDGHDLWATGLYVHDNGNMDGILEGGSLAYGHCFYVAGGPRTILENSICLNQASMGIHQYASNDANDNIYRYNWIENSGMTDARSGDGIAIINGSNATVHHNIVINNQGGISAFSSNNTIYNNTVYGNGLGHGEPGCCYPAMRIERGSNNIVRNNIVWNNAINSIDTSAAGSGTVSDYNLLTDPNFANAAAKNFNLTTTSTGAINQGIDVGFAFNDSAPDRGRYETATVQSAVTSSTSDVDVQVGSAYAPFTGLSACTGLGLIDGNGVSHALSGCSIPIGSNATIRYHCTNPCMVAGDNNIRVSHGGGGVSGLVDTQGQQLLAWNNFTVKNNLSGGGAVFTNTIYRIRVWNDNLTSNTAQDWYVPENTVGAVQNQDGKIAVMNAIKCTGGNCVAVGFAYEFDVNSSGSWTTIDNSCVTNSVCYDNTQVGGAVHGAKFATALLSTGGLTFNGNGGVVAQNSSFPVVDLAQNEITNYMGSFAIKNGLTAGNTQICVRPKQDSGAAISHDVTACFNVVNPGAQTP